MDDLRRTRSAPTKLRRRPAGLAFRPRIKDSNRRDEIVETALQLIAEHGLEATTRLLAERLSVSQPLIYRYFPTKDELVEAVFERLYRNLSMPTMQDALQNRAASIEDRIVQHYLVYTGARFTREWVRILLWAGLDGDARSGRYLKQVVEPTLITLCREILLHFGVDAEPSADQVEVLWMLHGGLHYAAIREHVYGLGAQPVGETRLRALAKAAIAGVVSLPPAHSPR